MYSLRPLSRRLLHTPMQVLRHDRPIRVHVGHLLTMRPEDFEHSARELWPALDACRVSTCDERRTADALTRRRDRPARRDSPAELVQPRTEHVQRRIWRKVDGQRGGRDAVCDAGGPRGASP